MFQLLDTGNVVPGLLFVSNTKMEWILSPETSVLIRVTRYHIPQDILDNHRRENLKSYNLLTVWLEYSCLSVNEELLERKVAAPV
jgi:hypothetical protein